MCYIIIVSEIVKDCYTLHSEIEGLIILPDLFINHSHICQSYRLIEAIINFVGQFMDLLIKC